MTQWRHHMGCRNDGQNEYGLVERFGLESWEAKASGVRRSGLLDLLRQKDGAFRMFDIMSD